MSFKVKDFYFKKAKKENFLARSIYKLEEIDKKYKVLRPGIKVVDLGYYPGSWIQYTSKVIGKEGKIVGIDIQEVNGKLLELGNVYLYQKDIFSINSLSDLGLSDKVEVVLSDMAPSTTGIRDVDQVRSFQLVEKLFTLLPILLRYNGNIVFKIFDGLDAQKFLKFQKKAFKELNLLRPKSTRSSSKEIFGIGKGYLGSGAFEK